jgi:hypothetical protein
MLTKRRKLTLIRLAAHDFRRALRIWTKEKNALDIIDRLVAERSKSMTSAMKTLGLSIILAFWLNSNRSSLSIAINMIDISVPSAYVNFALSIFLLGAIIALFNYFILNEFVRSAINYLLKFDASWAFTIPFEGSSAWSSVLMPQFRFFGSRTAHRFTTVASLVTITMPFLAVIIFCYFISFKVGISGVRSAGILSMETLLTFAGWGISLYPLVLFLIFILPFSFEKNIKFIRWNFLYRIHRRYGGYPTRASVWLNS